MDSTALFQVIDALETVGSYTDSTVEKIIIELTGTVIDEQEAGELKDYYKHQY